MDRQEAIRDMMDSIQQGKAADVQTKFNAIMQDRASAAVDDYKQELSKSVFKNPDLQAMGLADGEDHITEVDPAAGPEDYEDNSDEDI
tara:strand:- start:1544 stop:1807 length:264 start_codon:yes stop_codon:yes gene_type:complete